jgi:hypothetical protein
VGLVHREGGGGLRATETFGGNVVVTKRRAQIAISKQKPSDLFACKWLRAPATIDREGLADPASASPFRLPRLHPGIGVDGGDLSAIACRSSGALRTTARSFSRQSGQKSGISHRPFVAAGPAASLHVCNVERRSSPSSSRSPQYAPEGRRTDTSILTTRPVLPGWRRVI